MNEVYKKTELGWIPKEWQVLKLKDICKFKQGYQIPKKYQRQKPLQGYVRYLYITDFFSDKNKLYVKDKDKFYYIKEEDICIVNTGNTSGKSFRGAKGVLSNNMFKIFFDKEVLDSEFLWQYLQSDIYWKQIKRKSNLSGQPHVGHKNIGRLFIALPSLNEQKKIASILFLLDSHIEEIDNIIEDLKELKKGLIQKLLSGYYIVKNGKFIKTKEFKNTSLGKLPIHWKVKRLKEFVNFKNGYGFNASQYSKDGKIIIRMSNISIDGELKITEENTRYCSEEKYEKLKDYQLKKGDLVICMTDVTREKGIIGRTAIIDEDNKYILNQRVGKLEIIDKALCNTKYLHYYTNSDPYLRHIKSVSGGSAQSNLSTKEILNVKIPIPLLKEQERIVSIISSVDEKILFYRDQKEDYEKFKKGLVKQLLTGKVRIKKLRK